jgi:hypothetical protein
MKYREDLDLEQLDQLALEHWQDDLAKFFVKQKEPTYTEYNMFTAGYKAGYNAMLKENIILIKALKEIANTTDSDFTGNWVSEYHLRDIARAALEGK